MHPQRLALAIAAAVGMLCIFLPWATMPVLGSLTISVSGTSGYGWLAFGVCAAALGCAVAAGDKRNRLPGRVLIATALLGTIASLIAVWRIIRLHQLFAGNTHGSVGFGLYLLIAAGAAIALAPLVVRGPASRPRYTPPPVPPQPPLQHFLPSDKPPPPPYIPI